MSEKRFELRGLGIFDTENDNKSLSRVDVVDLLNNLNDDVKHLEEYCGDVEADVKRYSTGYTRMGDIIICCINDEEDENIYTIEDIADLLNEKESKIEQYHKINDEYAKQFERYQTLMEDKVNRLQEQLDKIPKNIKEIWLNG